MNLRVQATRSGRIHPAPACDLLDRLTQSLHIRFTLTDLHGAVVASTADRPAGRVNAVAARVAGSRRAAEMAPESGEDAGVYLPVLLSGRIAGVLIVHGAPDEVRTAARVAAVSIGLALDFAEAAAALGMENISAGWLLYRLLKGSREAAQQARAIAAVYGWNLFTRRVAIVVIAPRKALNAATPSADPLEALGSALGAQARTTPYGQIGESQWVILAEFESEGPWSKLRELANRVHKGMLKIGIETSVGVGQLHLPVNPGLAIRRSFREALFAADIGPKLERRQGVFELRLLGPAAFFAPSTPSRRNIAGLVLEPLAKHPAVLATLHAFFVANMSVAEAAERLEMHRHTVRNHLDRVHELTGLDPRSLEDAVQLRLALLVSAAGTGRR